MIARALGGLAFAFGGLACTLDGLACALGGLACAERLSVSGDDRKSRRAKNGGALGKIQSGKACKQCLNTAFGTCKRKAGSRIT